MQPRLAPAVVVAAGIGVNASPLNITVNVAPNFISEVECLVVNAVVNLLKVYPSRTPFCSSFLSIPFISSTVTATSTIFTTDVVTTITGTDTSTAQAFSYRNLTIITCVLSAAQKRDQQPSTKSGSLPAAIAIFASTQISTACSCLLIPTPRTTVTQTATTTPTITSVIKVAATATETPTTTVTVTSTYTHIVCPTPSSCENQGLIWAEYPNRQGSNNDATYSSFHPEIYKSQSPNVNGTTSTIGGISYAGTVAINIYGSSTTFNSDFFALDHKGYLFAVATGMYTFAFSGVDDAAFLWLGPNAYTGWTRANADLGVFYRSGPGSGSTKINLSEGTCLPIRIMFAQGQGSAVFQLSITALDGTVFLNSRTKNSPYVLQYSCDGITAPTYADWGSEL